MAKCILCGRKGLFLKVDRNGHCPNCAIEVIHQERVSDLKKIISDLEVKRTDENKLLEDAMAFAKTEAHRQLEIQVERLHDEERSALEKVADALGKNREYEDINAKLAKENQSLESKIAKSRTIVDSIKNIRTLWMGGYELETVVRNISAKFGNELSDLQLNCLNTKELRARYNAIRKQIKELCEEYESHYTTKANIAIYKLMVLALEAELESILYKLQFGKLDAAVDKVKELTTQYYAIATEGNQSITPTLKRFISRIEGMYIEIVKTEYEYFVQRERAREEQRAIKEQIRQEAEERKRLEQERKKVEAEEKKYRMEIDRIAAQMQQAHDDELENLRKRLEEMNAMMSKVEGKKAEIINLQNGKAGTVYIISNIGSFGDHVFKIGMTRRLEPQDRVNELGDASVPFPFDVHSFIFSEDAVALETALHHELNNRRVNKVNLRKEFFNVSIEELQALVERIDPTAPFKVTALAEQYRQSQTIDELPDEIPVSLDEE